MIPLSLDVHNFMSYKRAHLDFTLFGTTACLSGDNGAGKSALLEAITYALWGLTRVGNAEGLVHGSEREMEVAFAFLLEDEHYKVVRKYTKPATQKQSGQQSLAFMIWDGDDWASISTASVRETQALINGVLRMSYDVFANSSYIAQGRSAEFCKADPAQRKNVLAEILSLGLYDRLVEKVKADARDAELRAESEKVRIEAIRSTMGDPELLARDLKAAEVDLKLARADVKASDAALSLALSEQARFSQAVEARTAQKAAVARIEQEIADIDRQVGNCRLAPDSIALLAKREEIQRALQEEAELRSRDSSLEELAATYSEVMKRVNAARTDLAAAKARQEQAIGSLRSARQELATRAASVPAFEGEIARLDSALALQQKREEELTGAKTEAEGLRHRIALLGTDQDRLEREGKQLKNDLERVQKDEHCPVCGSNIGESRHNELCAQMQQRLQASRDEWQHRKSDLDAALARQKAVLKLAQELETQVSPGRNLLSELARIRESLAQARKAEGDLTCVETEIKALSEQAEGSQLALVQKTLTEAEAEAQGVGYDEIEHKKIKARLSSLVVYERQAQELSAVDARDHELAERRKELNSLRERRTHDLEAERGKLAAVEDPSASLAGANSRAECARGELSDARRRESDAHARVSGLKSKIADAEQMEGQVKESERKIRESLAGKELLSELALVWGRKGVQAMIIESVLPELEAMTNNILERLSDGRQMMCFKTQRQAKSGKVTETLDLEVHDELGVRNYGALSGGEGFRVDFAVRIALAKLLAHRAGARLQTLVVDEGFGSQDAANLQRLVEALHAVQSDFQKILIVSHVPDLKNQFPSRIEVSKTENGSVLEIVHSN